MLTIRDHSGAGLLTLEIGQGSKRVYTLMKEDYVSLKFSLAQPIHFGIGSYIDTEFGRFELTDLYQPKQNASTGGWDYDIQFDAHYYKWKNKIFKYIPEDANSEVSWSLTATLAVHMGVFLRNLVALGYDLNGTPYTFAIDDSVSDAAKLISYESTNLLDALYQMAEEYDCEVWVEDSVIHFGRMEAGEPIEFCQDTNVETMTAEGNRATYATRLYAFGSDKNLPPDYRPASSELAVNGVVQKRLMLPADTPYIDSEPGLATVEAVEQVLIFDDVYPRTRSAISDVSTVQYDVLDDDNNPTGETWDAYRFKIAGFEFSEDYILEDTDLQVIFQTGALAGLTFDVKFNPLAKEAGEADCQLWEIIRNEDYGRPLPDDTLKPADGNEVVLIGWDSTKIGDTSLITDAEQELKQRAIEEIKTLKIDPANYSCKMISASMFDAGGVWHPYSLGSRVTLINAGCFESGRRESRIIGYEYDLARPFDSPVYIVGEKAAISRTKELEGKVEALTFAGKSYAETSAGSSIYIIRTNDNTAASDTNVFSALRTKRDFLSRVRDDVALGKITFNNGLDSIGGALLRRGAQFGSAFASGPTGVGGQIDKDGHGELESLTLRSWLEVPELRFNRASVLLGDQWNAPGGGIIESVVIDTDGEGNTLRTGEITLKLEDGEIGAIAVDDICKGYFHDFFITGNNAEEDADDSKGNTEFSGFCTVYFRVTELLNDDGSRIAEGQAYEGRRLKFRYMLRNADGSDGDWHNSFHPYQAMHFVAYGNFNDPERQRSAYETRSYTRYLKGVNDWEFTVHNIAMQFGELSNLQVFGLDMSGYSAYLQNIYLTGTIRDVEIEAPVEVQVATSTGDTFIADGESITLTCSVRKAWQDLTSDVQSWAITRDSGDEAADAIWNANHTDFNGTIVLTQEDVGATELNVNAIFTVVATSSEWSVGRSIAIHTLYIPFPNDEMVVDTGGYRDIAWGETITATCTILRGTLDRTSQVLAWRVARDSGDATADAVWDSAHASFSGTLQIAYNSLQDDIRRTDGLATVFRFYADMPDGSTSSGSITI